MVGLRPGAVWSSTFALFAPAPGTRATTAPAADIDTQAEAGPTSAPATGTGSQIRLRRPGLRVVRSARPGAQRRPSDRREHQTAARRDRPQPRCSRSAHALRISACHIRRRGDLGTVCNRPTAAGCLAAAGERASPELPRRAPGTRRIFRLRLRQTTRTIGLGRAGRRGATIAAAATLPAQRLPRSAPVQGAAGRFDDSFGNLHRASAPPPGGA